MIHMAADRKYSVEEKHQLLENLELEVAHRTRQFEAWLADHLENFSIHQEGQVSRIPKQVRGMTMREFGEKYGGNVQAALRGYQRERLLAAGGDSNFGEIDKAERKRKWVASTQEPEAETSSNPITKEHGAPRPSKTARTQSPTKPRPGPGPTNIFGSAQRTRTALLNRTPSASRKLSRIPASPSPQKIRPPFTTSSRPPPRPASPVKHLSTRPNQPVPRVPSSTIFNPSLPSKGPSFPSGARLPRKDENMLSVNGSPIANPYDLGLQWFNDFEDETDEEPENAGKPRLKRTKSNIVVRRDPSVAFGGIQSRAASHTSSSSLFQGPSSQQGSTSHSTQPTASSGSQSKYPDNLGVRSNDPQTPKATRTFSAIVAIPTKDGHILEFNPLETSPGALDALEGVSESAKKQARLEMGRLVQSVDKWRLS